MAGRFPGAPTVDALWRLLEDGVDPSIDLSDAEIRATGVDPALLRDPGYVKRGTVLEGIDRFDAGFFGYSPREAAGMDPQHRLFLETAWHALEHAGHGAGEAAGPVGVFAGASLNTYALNHLQAGRDFLRSMEDLPALMSADKDFLATRVAYQMNLTGPAVVVQSTCSTSLVAICQACQSLRSYGCDLAVAGGVSVRVPERRGYLYQPGGILSPDGRCRAFDARAAGTYFSNGVGAVVLRRLEDALADGDEVHAVIRGWAVNNDGAAKVGYTAPSLDGQAAVIALAQAVAEVDPATIGCIEAHGTGTHLGDPIEVAALTRAFRLRTDRTGYCALGTIKSNFGHLDAAAGVAGFLKVVLSLKHGRVPPSLHFETPNPKIDFGSSPFFVNPRLRDWPSLGGPRRAGVSSFGIGGTNAHVVLEQAPAVGLVPARRSVELLTLSAKTSAALDRQATALASRLETEPAAMIADAAHTLQIGRRAFAHRRAMVCRDATDAVAALRSPAARGLEGVAREKPQVAFLFPGQGAQYPGMGRGLFETEPAFRDAVDRCAQVLAPELGLDLGEVLYRSTPGAADRSLGETELAQPALFTVEYALARTWMAWGVKPAAMLGHSIGEYVAACLAGVLTVEDALRLVAARGKLMQALPPGAMLAVSLAPDAAAEWVGGDIQLAAANGPELVVLSGPIPATLDLEARLRERGIAARRLATSRAFHSAMMDPILPAFAEEVRRVELRAPRIPYLANLTGRWITEREALDPEYWTSHLRHTVRFSEGIDELLRDPDRVMLEVGPGATLGAIARRRAGDAVPVVASIRNERDARPDPEFLVEAAGRLWVAGVSLDWRGFRGGERRRRMALPGYPFQRERHWVEPVRAAARAESGRRAPDPADWFYLPSWRRSAPAAPPPARRERPPERWLVLCGRDDAAERIGGRLAALGHDVTLVRHEALDPRDPDAFDALFRGLADQGRLPERVLHGWAAPGDGEPRRTVEVELNLAFFSAVDLGRALARAVGPAPVELVFLTRGAQDVLGTERVVPERATAHGIARVLPQEHPNISCRTVDFETETEALLAEVRSGGSDVVIAYRGAHRWVADVRRVSLDPAERRAPCLREGGVYLIAGGLGGVGLEIAEHLARAARAKLVLLARRAPDAAQLRGVAEIESLGGEVEIVAGDVSRPDDLEAAFDRARARFGAVHGAIHAAGVEGGRPIAETTRESAMPVLAPKVAGARALASICRREGCELLVLCSSLASVLGGIGQVDYAAANAFLDAFGSDLARDFPGSCVVIDWDAWSGVGMAARAAPLVSEPVRAALLRGALSPAEGVDALSRILAAGFAHVLVSTRDLVTRIDESARPAPPAPPAPPAAEVPSIGESEAPADRLDPREQLVARVWRELLGVERVRRDDDFFALGGHSLLATQMLNRLRQRLPGVDLKLEDVFRAPTVAGLARRIEAAEAAAPELQATGTRDRSGDGGRVRNVVLVLCTPRSGSSLFRLMLSAHPRLFCPPELWLLGHHTLREWYEDSLSGVYRDGLLRAFAELGGGNGVEPAYLVDQMVRAATPVQEVYRLLAERANGRLLVDKTPGYVLRPAALARAETLFEGARYLHLVRHPSAAIESFVRSRFDRFLEENGDPAEIAERTWVTGNANALAFRAGLPADRQLEVRYEALVSDPATVMSQVCAFLAVPFDQSVLRPYQRGKMLEGPGDPGLRTHSRIDPTLADAWRERPVPPLSARAREVAAALGFGETR
jgi:acyl transferase domain-containing protein